MKHLQPKPNITDGLKITETGSAIANYVVLAFDSEWKKGTWQKDQNARTVIINLGKAPINEMLRGLDSGCSINFKVAGEILERIFHAGRGSKKDIDHNLETLAITSACAEKAHASSQEGAQELTDLHTKLFRTFIKDLNDDVAHFSDSHEMIMTQGKDIDTEEHVHKLVDAVRALTLLTNYQVTGKAKAEPDKLDGLHSELSDIRLEILTKVTAEADSDSKTARLAILDSAGISLSKLSNELSPG